MTSPVRPDDGKTGIVSILVTTLAALLMWKYALFVASRWLPDSNIVTFGRAAWAGSLFVAGFLLALWRRHGAWEWLLIVFLTTVCWVMGYIWVGFFHPEWLPKKNVWFEAGPWEASAFYFASIFVLNSLAILFFKLPVWFFRRIYGMGKRRDAARADPPPERSAR